MSSRCDIAVASRRRQRNTINSQILFSSQDLNDTHETNSQWSGVSMARLIRQSNLERRGNIILPISDSICNNTIYRSNRHRRHNTNRNYSLNHYRLGIDSGNHLNNTNRSSNSNQSTNISNNSNTTHNDINTNASVSNAGNNNVNLNTPNANENLINNNLNNNVENSENILENSNMAVNIRRVENDNTLQNNIVFESINVAENNNLAVINDGCVDGKDESDFSVIKNKIKGGGEEVLLEENVENSESCPICMEAWSTTGLHRLVCLRCGHLFGLSCIEKWLGEGSKACPTCNAKAHRKDIRTIFARKLVAFDTSERDRLVVQVDSERQQRQQLEMQLTKRSLQLKIALADCQRLREESGKWREAFELNSEECKTLKQSSSSSNSSLLAFQMEIKFADNQQCRVMAYDQSSMSLCISQNSQVPLFADYGVRKISGEDWSSSEFMPMHSKLLRDLSFHADNNLLLSASVDKTLKLTSLHSKQVVQIYHTSSPVWSCCWSKDNDQHFFSGLVNSQVHQYDIRMTNRHLATLFSLPSCKSVLALHYLPRLVGTLYRPGGLLAGHLDSCSFYENTGTFKPQPLHLQGFLTSLSLDVPTSHLLASFRPTVHHPYTNHSVYHVDVSSSLELPTPSTFSSQAPPTTTSSETPSITTPTSQADLSPSLSWKCCDVHTFKGGPTQRRLSRSKLIMCPKENKLLACLPDEASHSVKIWSCANGQLQQSLSFHCNDVIDVCPITDGEDCRVQSVAFLSEKKVTFYKFL